jgi:hypothetical protein
MKMKMQVIQFASSVTVIQKKLMEVVGNVKNSMVQEFQHRTESELTEDPKIRRPGIQSPLRSNRPILFPFPCEER